MRLLKTLVIAMGVMLVVGFAALVVVIFNRMSAPKPEIPQTVAVPPPPAPEPPAAEAPIQLGQGLPTQFAPQFSEQPLTLPAGARVSDFSAGGDRLVLRIILADQSQQLMVVDLRSGTLIGTLKIENENETVPAPILPLLPSVMVPPRNKQEGAKK